MLLWHDSFEYANQTRFSAAYPTQVNWTSSGDWIQTSAVSASLTLPGTVTSSRAFVGFRLRMPTLPSADGTLLTFRTGGGTQLVRVRVQPVGGQIRLLFTSGDLRKTLLRTGAFSAADTYLEIECLFSSAGVITVRLNGIEFARAENVDTLQGSVFGWGQTRFESAGNGSLTRISDLYFGDGSGGFSFLGPVRAVRLFPARLRSTQWAPDMVSKRRLIVIAGQSNVNGRGVLSPYTGAGRSPNELVRAWDGNAWVNLAAGVGSLFPGGSWALEMMLGERIAALHEAGYSGDGIPATDVRIFRFGVDSSFVYPIAYGAFTWHPSVVGNRSDAMLAELNDAVTAAGGWGSIDHVHLVWYQGESEASNLITSFEQGVREYVQRTNEVLSYLTTAFLAPFSVTRIAMQLGLPAESFPYIKEIRGFQTRGTILGDVIDPGMLPLGPDNIHMSEHGQDILGSWVFQRWFETQDFAYQIKELFYNDESLLGEAFSCAATGTMTFEQTPELLSNLSAGTVLSISPRMLISSDTIDSVTYTIGDVALPALTIPVVSEWSFQTQVFATKASPEQVSGDITVQT